jgi:hypothetical protein
MDPRPKDKEKIVNEQDQQEPLNPQDREYQPAEKETVTPADKEKGYQEGNRKDNTTEEQNGSTAKQKE